VAVPVSAWQAQGLFEAFITHQQQCAHVQQQTHCLQNPDLILLLAMHTSVL